MNAIEFVASGARKVGYRNEGVVPNYSFADVLHPAAKTRTVSLAVFTQTPPSYRSAAIGVVTSDGSDAIELVNTYRALGAPLLFVVEGDLVTLWQVRSSAPPRIIERLAVTDLPALFDRHSDDWRPDSIHRAKSIGAVGGGYQLDFVDIGLLPAIEGEIHTKLDRLLSDALSAAKAAQRKTDGVDTRLLFRVVFRLLAAKVLQDRRHPWAADWDPDDLTTVLHRIESYYSLDRVPRISGQSIPAAFEAVWNSLRKGINFSNISADDLAFVYENTLITPKTRKLFGTHSTPRQVAEYVVQRLELHRHNPDTLNIYEPFAGAGVFLVSALRHLRDLLPTDWSDQQRHNFLIHHLAGDEIEPFACEVAKLSLILADYPNHNGWKISEADLFQDNLLEGRMKNHNVILCNPPFEAFSASDRTRYPTFKDSFSKASAVLDAALNAEPIALGFVLPRSFIIERQFLEQRQRIEKLYGSVEVVELPDRIFNASTVEASIVIASERRTSASSGKIVVRSTEICDRDRLRFLSTGHITAQRTVSRELYDSPSGELWIPTLFDLWKYLEDCPKLNSLFDLHLGARWTYDQERAVSATRKKGYLPGLFNAEDVKQFYATKVNFIDLNPAHLTHARGRAWAAPKIITNAVRLSRGPWRLAAVVDGRGLAFSQQLLGLWPKKDAQIVSLACYAAVLNGPVANAFLFSRYPAHRFRLESFGNIPFPSSLPSRLNGLIEDYVALVSKRAIFESTDARASELLNFIDAAVLEAYDLPLRLERQLLEMFREERRPVAHEWHHWDEEYSIPGLTLAESVSGRFRPRGNWTAKVFSALPESEAKLLRLYGE